MATLFQAILFDFDYTLADSSPAVIDCIGFAMREMGLAPVADEAACQTIGLSLADTWLRLAGLQHVDQGDALARRDTFVRLFIQRAEEVMVAKTTLFPFTRPTIMALKERKLRGGAARHLGIVSTKFRRRIEAILRRDGLLDVFDVLIGGEDVSRHKPHPESLWLAIERLGVSLKSVLYVGDSTVDAETAQRAGVAFVAVLSGVTPAEAFQGYDVYRMLPNLGGLLDLFIFDSPPVL